MGSKPTFARSAPNLMASRSQALSHVLVQLLQRQGRPRQRPQQQQRSSSSSSNSSSSSSSSSNAAVHLTQEMVKSSIEHLRAIPFQNAGAAAAAAAATAAAAAAKLQCISHKRWSKVALSIFRQRRFKGAGAAAAAAKAAKAKAEEAAAAPTRPARGAE